MERYTGKCVQCNEESCDLIAVRDDDGDISFLLCEDCNNAVLHYDENRDGN